MKIALSVLLLSLLSLVSVDGFVPQARRHRVAFTATAESLALLSTTLFSTAVWKEPRTLWMPRTSSNDGIVSAMAMLNQAKMELSEVSSSSSNVEVADDDSKKNPFQFSFNDDKDTTSMKSRAEQWERSVFDAMEQMELQIEQSAQSTGKRSLQLVQRAFEPLSRLRMPSWGRSKILDMQKLEMLEQTVFAEMERLEQFLEQSASNTGTCSMKLFQAAIDSIRTIENQPQARRAKIAYTQKLASMVRDMADRLESQAEKEKRAVEDEEDVLVTSVYRTRVRRTHRRRRPGIISSFLTRLAWKVSAKWHRA